MNSRIKVKGTGLLVALGLFFSGQAQMNEVTGGNIGVTAFGGLKMNAATNKEVKMTPGYFFGAGITTGLFSGTLFPEVNYSFSSVNYGNDSLGAGLINKSQNLGLGLNTKINFLRLKLGKSSKGECWWLNFKLLLGYNYNLHFSNNHNFNYLNQNDHSFDFGIGINPKYSGGHKSRVAWTYFYEVGYSLDMNKNGGFSLLGNSDWKQNGLFFRVTILHHKTADFLGGNDKKKSYGKRY